MTRKRKTVAFVVLRRDVVYDLAISFGLPAAVRERSPRSSPDTRERRKSSLNIHSAETFVARVLTRPDPIDTCSVKRVRSELCVEFGAGRTRRQKFCKLGRISGKILL